MYRAGVVHEIDYHEIDYRIQETRKDAPLLTPDAVRCDPVDNGLFVLRCNAFAGGSKAYCAKKMLLELPSINDIACLCDAGGGAQVAYAVAAKATGRRFTTYYENAGPIEGMTRAAVDFYGAKAQSLVRYHSALFGLLVAPYVDGGNDARLVYWQQQKPTERLYINRSTTNDYYEFSGIVELMSAFIGRFSIVAGQVWVAAGSGTSASAIGLACARHAPAVRVMAVPVYERAPPTGAHNVRFVERREPVAPPTPAQRRELDTMSQAYERIAFLTMLAARADSGDTATPWYFFAIL